MTTIARFWLSLAASLPALLTAFAQIKPEAVIHYRQQRDDDDRLEFRPDGRDGQGQDCRGMRRSSPSAPSASQFLAPQVLEGFAEGSDKGAETDAKAGHLDQLRRLQEPSSTI